MKRLIPFAVICGIYTYLAWRFFGWLGHPLIGTPFAVGIGVAALAGFTWFRVSDWWSSMTRPYQPQTVKSETKESPVQILRAALWATVKLSLFIAMAIVLIAVLAGTILGWPAWLSLNP